MIKISEDGKNYWDIKASDEAELDTFLAKNPAFRVVRGKSNFFQGSKKDAVPLFAAAEYFNSKPAIAAFSSSKSAHRIIVAYGQGAPEAPQTVTVNGRTLSFTGYGKAWRGAEDAFSTGAIGSGWDMVRYAYYA